MHMRSGGNNKNRRGDKKFSGKGKIERRSSERRSEEKPDKPFKGKPKGKGGSPSFKPEDLELKNEIRLNKYIASSGICSRREADKLIADGLITVNGKVITALGTKIKPSDEVQYGGERLRFEKYIYVLMNKPKGVITTADDPQGRPTVVELVANSVKERVYPVGRLDRATTGLLLMTNDGDLAKRLTHPSHEIRKVYNVVLNKAITKADMKRLLEGVQLEDGMSKADAISYVRESESKKDIGIELHSGKNRVIRRMMESLGYKVTKLDRVEFAGLTKKNLPRGKWRFLNEREVGILKMKS